jgi:methyl-accepting chemotaxis protein
MNWFYNMKTMKKLILGFSLVCAIMACVGYTGITKMGEINAMNQVLFERELFGVSSAKEAAIKLTAIGRAVRMVVLETEMEAMQRQKSNIDQYTKEFEKALADTETTLTRDDGKARAKKVREGFASYKKNIDAEVTLGMSNKDDEALAKIRSDSEIAEIIDKDIAKLAEIKQEVAKQNYDRATEIYQTSTMVLIATISLGIILALGIGIFVASCITRPLKKAVTVLQEVSQGDFTTHLDVDTKDEVGMMATALNAAVVSMRDALIDVRGVADNVASASQQLAAASEEISSGAQEQASSLEETASSLEEITSTIKQNADNATQANQLSNNSREIAEKGGKVVGDAVTGMAEINAASKKIADIITTIDEIAFQTNLLALNAAVEAARAGEQGRGFAVVAAEVRNLAQRSAAAAKEIKGLIQDSVRKVEIGSDLVNQSGRTLDEIITSVKRVTDIVAEIAAASREQATGIEQVNKAVAQMDQVTQENASQTEELSGTAEGLSSQAEGLQELVQRFKLEQGTNTATKVAVTAPATAKTPVKAAKPTKPASKPMVSKSPAKAKTNGAPTNRLESNGNGHTHELDLVGVGAHDGFEEF